MVNQKIKIFYCLILFIAVGCVQEDTCGYNVKNSKLCHIVIDMKSDSFSVKHMESLLIEYHRYDKDCKDVGYSMPGIHKILDSNYVTVYHFDTLLVNNSSIYIAYFTTNFNNSKNLPFIKTQAKVWQDGNLITDIKLGYNDNNVRVVLK